MNAREKAKKQQLEAQLKKVNEDIEKLYKVKANLQSQLNTFEQVRTI